MAPKKRAARLVDPAKVENLLDLPVVEVSWRDAASNAHWEDFRDIRTQPVDGLVECQTVGYLVKLGKHAVILAQTRAGNGRLAGDWSIPRRGVHRIKVIHSSR